MAKIAYILLCHKDPDAIIQQARLLTAGGDCLSIHFDARAPKAAYQKIKDALSDNPNVAFARKRIKCGWGEWSLVGATLHAVEAALDSFPDITHCYMISGDCAAIKSSRYIHDYLDREHVDYIESFDFFESNWIKTGIKEERLIYRHWFNERTQSKLYYWSFALQQKLGLKREIPSDLEMHIGSQWWCLRRETLQAILELNRQRPDIIRFFKTTWIPDETFFQTMVRYLVPSTEIRSRTLTFLMFTDYGLPVVFYNDHYDLLLSQSHLFARKISPEALELRQRLGQLYSDSERQFQISENGRNLFHFLTSQGRHGRRFAGRFWETEASLGWDRELMIVVAKKWHIGKRFLQRLRDNHVDIPMLEYVFNETNAGLPDLGGIEASMSKRMRHRRAVLRMLYEHFDRNHMIICMDPSGVEMLKDFASDRSKVRILEVQTDFSDDFLRGHAQRTGLASNWTPPEVLEQLVPTIRKEFLHEQDSIRAAGLDHHWIISHAHSDEMNAAQIAQFLDIPAETALKIAQSPDLFTD